MVEKLALVIAATLLAGCSIYSKLDYEVRPSVAPGGVTLVCKESSSGACQFLVAPGGGTAVARYDVTSGRHKDLDGLHAGTKVCAVARPGASCTPQEAAVGR